MSGKKDQYFIYGGKQHSLQNIQEGQIHTAAKINIQSTFGIT